MNNLFMGKSRLENKNIIYKILRKFSVIFIILASLFFAREEVSAQDEKKIFVCDEGLCFQANIEADNVGNTLNELRIKITDKDVVIPARDSKIYSGSKIIIMRAKKITITENGKTFETYTTSRSVEQVVWEQKSIKLEDDDITKPARNMTVADGMKITVIHVLLKEETVEKPINYKTVTNEDDSLSWRIKKVTQKGEKGINEIKYKVVYYDGKEISRKMLSQDVTKKPVEEVVTQGTYVKVGKAHTGQASWYAYTGTMSAANPWLPMGSYVKVTNKDNGKSVIVKINDRGPFGPGRIIDLDKVAFAKIADLGQGVANIKMEEIVN